MIIYLDIDDTLIHTDLFKVRPANYIGEFLNHVVNKYPVYWLTTHCMDGDVSRPIFYLSRIFPEELMPLIIKIRPTKWVNYKIEAINMNEEFMWFDDILYPEEEKILREHNKFDSHIKVDLDKDHNILGRYLYI